MAPPATKIDSVDAAEDTSSLKPNAAMDVSNQEVMDIHAVVLINYLRTHHVLALQEFAKRVRKLTVLLSVPMEPDRNWETQWGELDVQVQKNFMWTSNWKHSSGFSEPNFIHLPVDTPWRLWKLKPDIVLSYEMGARTMLSTFYRMFSRKVPLVMVGNMSQHIEKERGLLRRVWRKLLWRGCDYFTYNGPSCKRYLKSLGIPEERMFCFPYCIDQSTVFRGEKQLRKSEVDGNIRRLLYCGAISERKGILQFSRALSKWCAKNPNQRVELIIAGSGELKEKVAESGNESLTVKFLGDCNVDQLRDAYGLADICVFPTFADEWGLVPVEAMASGVPVLGSIFAQSVESCCVESHNGWIFDPTVDEEMFGAIDRAMSTSNSRLHEMGLAAKDSVARITPQASGGFLADAVSRIRSNQPIRKHDSFHSLQRQTS